DPPIPWGRRAIQTRYISITAGYTIQVTTDREEGARRRSGIAYVPGGPEFKTLNRLPLERTLYASCCPETIGSCEPPLTAPGCAGPSATGDPGSHPPASRGQSASDG